MVRCFTASLKGVNSLLTYETEESIAQVLIDRSPVTLRHVPPIGQQLSFHANLESWVEGMDYCAVPVPAEITEALGTKGPVLVMARVNDSEPFKVSLFPVGGGQHYTAAVKVVVA